MVRECSTFVLSSLNPCFVLDTAGTSFHWGEYSLLQRKTLVKFFVDITNKLLLLHFFWFRILHVFIVVYHYISNFLSLHFLIWGIIKNGIIDNKCRNIPKYCQVQLLSPGKIALFIVQSTLDSCPIQEWLFTTFLRNFFQHFPKYIRKTTYINIYYIYIIYI